MNIMIQSLRVVEFMCLGVWIVDIFCGYCCGFVCFLIICLDSLSEKPCIKFIIFGFDILCKRSNMSFILERTWSSCSCL